MFGWLKRNADIRVIKLSLCLAALYFIMFNTPVLLYKHKIYSATPIKALLELGRETFIVFIATFIAFLGFSFHRYLLIASTIFLFVTGAAASYYLFFYNHVPSKTLIKVIFENTVSESIELISLKLLLWICFSVFVGIYTLAYFKVKPISTYFVRIISAGCLAITIFLIANLPYRAVMIYYPHKYLNSTYLYLLDTFQKKNSRIDISEQFKFEDHSAEDLNIVFVIGESSRYDHYSLLGYERETNPNLSKINNLFAFKGKSCGVVTFQSVPHMISRVMCERREEAGKETSIVSIFNKLKIPTHWYAVQTIKGYMHEFANSTFYDEPENIVVNTAGPILGSFSLDGELLPFLDKALEDPKKKFVVLHTLGSHWDYENRYPAEFRRFMPHCAHNPAIKRDHKDCPLEQLINSYDNSILYTDYFLSQVIERLKSKNAIVIYSSDHATALGENGYYGHAYEMEGIKTQYMVPFIVWMSDKFIEQNPEKLKAVKSLVGTELIHDQLFHSLLDCGNIKSDIIVPELSICRPQTAK